MDNLKPTFYCVPKDTVEFFADIADELIQKLPSGKNVTRASLGDKALKRLKLPDGTSACIYVLHGKTNNVVSLLFNEPVQIIEKILYKSMLQSSEDTTTEGFKEFNSFLNTLDEYPLRNTKVLALYLFAAAVAGYANHDGAEVPRSHSTILETMHSETAYPELLLLLAGGRYKDKMQWVVNSSPVLACTVERILKAVRTQALYSTNRIKHTTDVPEHDLFRYIYHSIVMDIAINYLDLADISYLHSIIMERSSVVEATEKFKRIPLNPRLRHVTVVAPTVGEDGIQVEHSINSVKSKLS